MLLTLVKLLAAYLFLSDCPWFYLDKIENKKIQM